MPSSPYPELGAFVRNITTSPSLLSISLEKDILIYLISFVLLSSSVAILLPYTQSEVKVPIPLATSVTSKKKRKEAYCFDSRATLKQGYGRFKETPFGVDSMEGVKLVVPLKFLDKLRSHPSLSFQKSIDNDLLKHYSGVGGLDTRGVNILHTKFNPTLHAFIPQIHGLVRQHLPSKLGPAKDWTAIRLHEGLTEIVARASAFVMHNEEASQSPEWLQVIQEYVMHAVEYAQALKVWPSILRPVICRFLPQSKELARLWGTAGAIIKETLDAKKSGVKVASDPPTIIDYLTSGPNADLVDDVDCQVEQQLHLAVASIHTTSSSVLHCLFDLAARPEYISELRQEAKEVLESCGGVYSKQGLLKLEKLDSFMKESQRVSSPDLTTFQRMALTPFDLPDGTHVPAKTKLEIATSAINMDAAYFEDPETFDGFRFYRRRQNGETNLAYTSVGKTNLGWGVGRHACPGRFLADIEIKLVVSEILLHYDIKNPEGQGRHKNVEFEAVVFPDPEAEILLKAINP
ncbi:cytochrome P450 [Ilyonectria destructans]|nr:cytochrome P450 [Ilyonectria destructans]